jgi:hypothetical protein
MARNTATDDRDRIWTEPFVPDDEIGRRTGEECVRCTVCGLTTLAGTEDTVVHKRGCAHRGGD